LRDLVLLLPVQTILQMARRRNDQELKARVTIVHMCYPDVSIPWRSAQYGPQSSTTIPPRGRVPGPH